MINIIVAVNKKNYIGKDNSLMWHNPEDLQLFKSLTKGQILIMGRKTWDSLPKKPLPERYSIVVSRTITDRGENFHFDDSILDPKILEFLSKDSKTYWVIGGEEMYKLFLPYANMVYVSKIDNDEEGDAKFDMDFVKENFILRATRYAKTFKQKIYEAKSNVQ